MASTPEKILNRNNPERQQIFNVKSTNYLLETVGVAVVAMPRQFTHPIVVAQHLPATKQGAIILTGRLLSPDRTTEES
jgi:chemotaxis response regulator CheB